MERKLDLIEEKLLDLEWVTATDEDKEEVRRELDLLREQVSRTDRSTEQRIIDMYELI